MLEGLDNCCPFYWTLMCEDREEAALTCIILIFFVGTGNTSLSLFLMFTEIKMRNVAPIIQPHSSLSHCFFAPIRILSLLFDLLDFSR